MALSTIPFSALSSDASKQGVNFRNLIINGDMSIAQRGTSVTGSTSSGYLTVDRWNFARAGSATFSHSQTTDVPTGQGFANSYKIESTTGEGAFGATELNILTQLIEAQNLNSLKWGTSSAESITLSFWVKATVTGTYIVEFYNNDNAGDQLSSSYTINSANTWEKKTITAVGYTSGAFGNDNLTGMQINWWLGAGSAYQSGSLTNTWRTYADANRAVGQVNTFENNNNTFYITGVQLEVGTSASDFEFLPYDVNLTRCMRYFERVSKDGNRSYAPIANGMQRTTTQAYGHVMCRVLKRASATSVSQSNIIVTDRKTTDADVTAIGNISTDYQGVHMDFTHSSFGADFRPVLITGDNATGGYVDIDSEL